jgi:serine/threonine protein kinase
MNNAGIASVPDSVATPTIPEHTLLRPIASGSYGQVWLARNALDVYRAVKVVYRNRFDHARPFEREFAGIRAFEPISRSHENLVDLLQVGRDDKKGYFYCVMELADDLNAVLGERREALGSETAESAERNERSNRELEEPSHGYAACTQPFYTPHTLASDLKRRGGSPLRECIRLGLSLTEALSYLHGKGLVHRDIKPSNIIFVGGVPKLADVGLVASIGEARSYVGTEGFIPPEGPGTAPADLYSLGLVLYQMSTGKSEQDFPEPLPDLAAQPDHTLWLEFNAVIHKACQADPRQRYRSASEMHAELALLQKGKSVKQHQQRKRRFKLAWRATPAVGLLILTIGLLAIFGTSHQGVYEGKSSPIPEANRLFSLGEHSYEKKTAESLHSAMQYFERAVEVDTNFAKGYAWLAACETWSYATTNRPFELLPEARTNAQHALSLDKSLGRAYMALAWNAWLREWDWDAADNYFRRARGCARGVSEFAETHGLFQSSIGRTNEAIETLHAALRAEPRSISARHFLAGTLISARRYQEAIDQLSLVIEMEPSGTLLTYGVLSDALICAGQFERGIEMARQQALRTGVDPAQASARAQALLSAYQSKGAKGYWERLLDWVDPQREPYQFAQLCARVGRDAEALDWLEKAARQHDWAMVFGSGSVKADPAWDHLQGQPRFKAVLKKINLGN